MNRYKFLSLVFFIISLTIIAVLVYLNGACKFQGSAFLFGKIFSPTAFASSPLNPASRAQLFCPYGIGEPSRAANFGFAVGFIDALFLALSIYFYKKGNRNH